MKTRIAQDDCTRAPVLHSPILFFFSIHINALFMWARIWQDILTTSRVTEAANCTSLTTAVVVLWNLRSHLTLLCSQKRPQRTGKYCRRIKAAILNTLDTCFQSIQGSSSTAWLSQTISKSNGNEDYPVVPLPFGISKMSQQDLCSGGEN